MDMSSLSPQNVFSQNGYSFEKSGQLASACGYEVCQVIGAKIPEDGWARIKKFLS